MTLFNSVHFSSPMWLWLIPVILLVVLLSHFKRRSGQSLEQVVDPKLLPHLVLQDPQSKRSFNLTLISVLVFCLSLAGISWSKVATPGYESTHKTVLVVDQSLSMFATDAKPNRQTQLKQAVRDILQRSQEGEIALVAFAGEGYVISPFSQDRETITHFLLALDPLIMPVYGSQLSLGIKTALSLSKDPNESLQLIVFTDDVNRQDLANIKPLLEERPVTLDVIAIGTQTGAAIQLPDGRQLKQQGQTVIAKTPIETLKNFTKQLGGHFYQARLSPSELDNITQSSVIASQLQESQTASQQWQNQGHWFALPLLFCLALRFRKGLLMAGLGVILLLPNEHLLASPLDWFRTPDQKAQLAVDQGDWQTAQQYFQDPQWQAASAYALEDYPTSIEALQSLTKNARDYYNLGNALALNGNIEQAIEAYENALAEDPSLTPAQENLDYLRQQQKAQQEQDQQQQQGDSQQHQASPSNDSSQQQANNQSQQGAQQEQSQQQGQTSPSQDDNQQADGQKTHETQDKPSGSEDNSPHKDGEADNGETPLNKEQTQALNQWLRQIQDDPGSLLQRKLWYLHQEKRSAQQYRQEDGQNPW